MGREDQQFSQRTHFTSFYPWFNSRKIGTIPTFEDHVRKFGTNIAYVCFVYGQVQREKLKTAQDTKVGVAVRLVRLDDLQLVRRVLCPSHSKTCEKNKWCVNRPFCVQICSQESAMSKNKSAACWKNNGFTCTFGQVGLFPKTASPSQKLLPILRGRLWYIPLSWRIQISEPRPKPTSELSQGPLWWKHLGE